MTSRVFIWDFRWFIKICFQFNFLAKSSKKFRASLTFKVVISQIFLILIIIAGAGWYYFNLKSEEPNLIPAPLPANNDPVKAKENLIRLNSPKPNDVVSSPLLIDGEARGTWYFEASFPVKLFDGNGKELAITPAQTESDWMTTEFVPFSATLVFDAPQTATGTLVLEKDNPSGLPENDESEEMVSGSNNVNIEREMSELAENTLRFKFASKKVGEYYRSMQNVIKGGGGRI